MAVSINGIDSFAKVKLQQLQMQKGIQGTGRTSGANKADMNSSIWTRQNSNPVQGSPNSTPVQSAKGTENTQQTTNIFSRINNAQASATQNTGPTGASYENPKALNSLQDISKAKVALHTRMAKEGTNYKLEQLDMQLDTRRSELSQNSQPANSAPKSEGSSGGEDSGSAIKKASNAISSAKNSESSGNKRISDSSAQDSSAQNISNDADKKQKKLNKNSRALKKSMNKANKASQKNDKQMQKLNSKVEKYQADAQDAMNELQSLSTGDSTGVGKRSAYSLSLGGEDMPDVSAKGKSGKVSRESNSRAETGGSDNSAKMQELSQRVNKSADGIKKTGRQMNKLKTANGRIAKTAAKNVKAKNKYYKKTMNGLRKNETTSDKIIKYGNVTTKVGDGVKTVGGTTELVGKGVFAVGTLMASNPYTASAAPSVQSFGTKTESFGQKVSTGGKYVSAAGNTTATAGNLAKGDTSAALKTAGAAVMDGLGAAQGTQNIQKAANTAGKTVQNANKAAGDVKDISKQVDEEISKRLGNV